MFDTKDGSKLKGGAILGGAIVIVGTVAAVAMWGKGDSDKNQQALQATETSAVEETSTQLAEVTDDTLNEMPEVIGDEPVQAESEFEHARRFHKYADLAARMAFGARYPTEDRDSGAYHENLYCYGDNEDNSFAIYDVDGDGRDELIVIVTNGSMAEMSESIYDYDFETDEVNEELYEFPGVKYYEGGLALVEWSHNQGFGDAIYPYNIYKYNPQTDKYESVGYADSWNKEISETDYDGNPFPEDVDKDGDGNIFFISENSGTKTVDNKEYDEWYSSLVGGREEITLDTQTMSWETLDPLTQDYMGMLLEENRKKIIPNTDDIGVMYIEKNGNQDEIRAFFETKYGVKFKDVEQDYWVESATGKKDGKKVLEIYYEDGGYISYTNPIESVNILGVVPGMSEEDAKAALQDHGFYWNGYTYITGEFTNNFAVGLNVENGKVTEVSIYWYNEYVG